MNEPNEQMTTELFVFWSTTTNESNLNSNNNNKKNTIENWLTIFTIYRYFVKNLNVLKIHLDLTFWLIFFVVVVANLINRLLISLISQSFQIETK